MICEVCGAEIGGVRLDLGYHPLCDDLVPIGQDDEVGKFHQLIALCEVCLTAHQVKPVAKELLFKPNYHYRAGLTKDVLLGMYQIVESLRSDISTLGHDAVILDIGCNDGSLLGIFKEKYRCVTIGVEPTNAIHASGSKVDEKYNSYFSENVTLEIIKRHPKIDFITFTNVFAHIENLPHLISNLKLMMDESTSLVVENHYLGAILERNQFDTFYHEHPRTYSLKSFQCIADSLGAVITKVEFPSRYGGNIRVTMRKQGIKADISSVIDREDQFQNDFSALQHIYDQWKSEGMEVIRNLSSRGNVYGKSLPGRAVMLMNSLEIDATIMPGVFEQPHSPKVGTYVPGSKIQVMSDDDLMEVDPDILIVWSWHIIDEVTSYLNSMGFSGEIWVPLPKFRLHRPAL